MFPYNLFQILKKVYLQNVKYLKSINLTKT